MFKARSLIKNEYSILIPIIIFLLLNFVFPNYSPYTISAVMTKLTTISIFIIMLSCTFNIVKHADRLAEIFGEPYGTLILTLAVITIEVALIVTMMLIGKGDATLARDTMFAVIMIAVNGFAGLSLLTGGIKHSTQVYNIEGASSYIAVLIPLITVCLILPNYTISTEMGTLNSLQSIVIILVCIMLYSTFLIKQTITHQECFRFSLEREKKKPSHSSTPNFIIYHITLLFLGLITMIALSKNLGTFLEYSIQVAGLPHKLGGFIIALLVLTPEGVSAIQAAYKNQLQRSINLCMGSAVATICLTVPSVLIISLLIGEAIILGLNNSATVIMILTFFISLITFTSRRTSTLNGMVLLSVFIVYVALIFDIA